MKRSLRLSFAIYVCIFAVLICGCAPQSSKNANTITVWHWMTDREAAFTELARRYEAKTGIKVNFELYAPSDQYSQKVRAATQGNTLPDIFGVLGEKRDFGSFIKAGRILDLSVYMLENNSQWKNEFFPKALAVNEFPVGNSYAVAPGIYGVPIDVMAIKMLYNKGLLKQLGYNQPPKDFAGFLEVGKKVKAANMNGLVCGWGEPWLINCMADNYAFNIMGKDKFLATLRGEVAYTDPDWIKVFTVFKDMQESGVLAPGVVTMINKSAEQLFANNKAVFALNGSWCVNVYKHMNPDLNYGVMLPPKVTDKFPMTIWAGAGSSFMVNASSRQKEEAVKFLKWLTEKDQQAYLAERTVNLPANQKCLKEIPEILAQFADDMDNTTHPNIWNVDRSSAVSEAIVKGIQSIILGEKTPEQTAKYVQSIKERETVKNKKR